MRWNGTSLKSNLQLVEDEGARQLQGQSAPTASVTAWARAGSQRVVVLERVSLSVMVSVASSLCLQMVVDPAVPEVKSDEEASMICGADHTVAFILNSWMGRSFDALRFCTSRKMGTLRLAQT